MSRFSPLIALFLLIAAGIADPIESFAPSPSSEASQTTKPSSRRMFQGADGNNNAKETTNTNDDNKTNDFEVQTRNPLRLLVLKLGLTEPAMTSPFNYGKYDGVFHCAYCGQPLFDSDSKYDSGSGWPSFWRSANDDSIGYKMEFDGRLECRCKRCSSHLGHVFLDGPRPASVSQELLEASPESDPRGRTNTYLPRFCINGAAMTFKSREDVEK